MKKLIATMTVAAFAAGFVASANAARTITLNNTLVNTSSSNRVAYTGPVTPITITPSATAANNVKSSGFIRNYTPIRKRATFIPTP
ncbi:MAG: hypothetical protein GC138_00680 [Gammaproteobacteria bacterium]|nr:hypothetical protein [Gammaproteobacteria bacterium]